MSGSRAAGSGNATGPAPAACETGVEEEGGEGSVLDGRRQGGRSGSDGRVRVLNQVRVPYADSCSGYGALAEGCGGRRVGLERGIERRQLRDAGDGLPWPDVSVHESRDGVACVRHSPAVLDGRVLSARERVWVATLSSDLAKDSFDRFHSHLAHQFKVHSTADAGSYALAENPLPSFDPRLLPSAHPRVGRLFSPGQTEWLPPLPVSTLCPNWTGKGRKLTTQALHIRHDHARPGKV